MASPKAFRKGVPSADQGDAEREKEFKAFRNEQLKVNHIQSLTPAFSARLTPGRL